MDEGPFFEDVAVGDDLLSLHKRPSNVQLFRFSAITWNAHRIHFDHQYALKEGHPEILVQAHLHGSFLAELVTSWMGPRGELLSFGWQNRGPAFAGDELVCTGTVSAAHEDGTVELQLEERKGNEDLCAPGWATVRLPRRQAGTEAATSG